MPGRMFSFSDTWVFRNSLSGVYMWLINKVCRMVSLKTLFLLPFKKIAEFFISGKFKSTSSGATQSRPPVLTFSFQTQQCITTASTPISWKHSSRTVQNELTVLPRIWCFLKCNAISNYREFLSQLRAFILLVRKQGNITGIKQKPVCWIFSKLLFLSGIERS